MTTGNAWTVMAGPRAARSQEALQVSGVAGDGVPSGLPPSLLEDNPWWQAPWADGHPEVFFPLEAPQKLTGRRGWCRGRRGRSGQLGLFCLVF